MTCKERMYENFNFMLPVIIAHCFVKAIKQILTTGKKSKGMNSKVNGKMNSSSSRHLETQETNWTEKLKIPTAPQVLNKDKRKIIIKIKKKKSSNHISSQ